MTVGQAVPLVSDTRFDNYGNQINNFQYKDIGIILSVTPFITSDGLVQMIVSPQSSSISDQTVQVAQGLAVPIINKTVVNTVIITPNDMTAVIGGLMQDNKTGLDSKIPILGDIPLLGNLFKRKQSLNAKSELVIFLTPHIIPAPTELASVTTQETKKIEMAPGAFTEQQLDKYLEGVPIKQTPKPSGKKEKGSNPQPMGN